jgi:hypothetical protein
MEMSVYGENWIREARDECERTEGCHLYVESRKGRKEYIQTPSPMSNIRDTQISHEPRDRNLELSKTDTCQRS